MSKRKIEGMLTPGQAAAVLGISTHGVAKMLDRGRLEGDRTTWPGGDRRIDPDSLRIWLQRTRDWMETYTTDDLDDVRWWMQHRSVADLDRALDRLTRVLEEIGPDHR